MCPENGLDVVDRHSWRREHWRFVALPGKQVPPLQGVEMSCRSPRNMIVAKMERPPSAAPCDGLPTGREHRPMATLRLGCGVTLRDLIEREEEGS
jgi:hypothetical protein